MIMDWEMALYILLDLILQRIFHHDTEKINVFNFILKQTLNEHK